MNLKDQVNFTKLAENYSLTVIHKTRNRMVKQFRLPGLLMQTLKNRHEFFLAILIPQM